MKNQTKLIVGLIIIGVIMFVYMLIEDYGNSYTESIGTNEDAVPSASVNSALPDYWQEAIRTAYSKVETIKNSADGETLEFIWFSDPHIYPTNTKVLDLGMVVAETSEQLEIPLVVCSGDIMTQDSPSSEETVLSIYENTVKSVFSPINKDYFLCAIGNHDGMWGSRLIGAETFSYMKQIDSARMAQLLFEGRSENFRGMSSSYGLYYYYDSLPDKTRFIVLCSHFSGDDSTDAEGNAVYNRMKTSVYGQKQLDWLSASALDMPQGYNAVIVSHVPIDESADGALLDGIITAYCNKTSYESGDIAINGDFWGAGIEDSPYKLENVSVDFSDAKGDIIAYLHGHTHADSIDTETLPCPMIGITGAGGDIRDYNLSCTGVTGVSINMVLFTDSVGEIAGTYTFKYTNGQWKKTGGKVSLEQYGIGYVDTAAEGAEITVELYKSGCRTGGTATETAMDIVSIDLSTKTVYMTRLGAGDDRVYQP